MADIQENKPPATTAPATTSTSASPSQPLPRVAIQFCTQCKWMLRAAYFAQELLSTFSTSLGEVALIPATGGIFTVTITTPSPSSPAAAAETKLLWDRKTDGGFPETKELKRRVRDVIDPGRDLGHVDRHSKPKTAPAADAPADMPAASSATSATSAPAPGPAPSSSSLNLKKHPAVPVPLTGHTRSTADPPPPVTSAPIYEQQAGPDEELAARVARAKANKGQQSANTVDGESLKAQLGKSSGRDRQAQQQQEVCEDCA